MTQTPPLQVEEVEGCFRLGAVGRPALVDEMLLTCRAAWCLRSEICTSAQRRAPLADAGASLAVKALTSLNRFQAAYCTVTTATVAALEGAYEDAVVALGWYNSVCRLRIYDRQSWPRHELEKLLRSTAATLHMYGAVDRELLPPQTPCEVVPDECLWWGFGAYDVEQRWIGHGYAWRGRPASQRGRLMENAAGNAVNDFDSLEDGFRTLKKAKVLCADYGALRADFPALLKGKSDAEIDEWLMRAVARLSAGQVRRLSPGGDHHSLLGVDMLPGGIADVVDGVDVNGAAKADGSDAPATAIRLRSGGRAATFFVDDGRYRFVPETGGALLAAPMIDVKGVGTHQDADISSPHVTGLLCFIDALKELAFQRLLQHVLEREGVDRCCSTVRFYGIIDTGLKYVQKNPATGWAGDRCVLLLRQRQSRIVTEYQAMSFSGNVPSGPATNSGATYVFRRIMHQYGISPEEFPVALLTNHGVGCDHDGATPEAAIAMLSHPVACGNANLQADAACVRHMDLSDYFVLPNAPVSAEWRMSLAALRRSVALGPMKFQRMLAEATTDGAKNTLQLLLGESSLASPEAALQAMEAVRVEASKVASVRDGAVTVDEATGVVAPMKPKYCMCWFMELDDSPMAGWCKEQGAVFHRLAGEPDLLATIDAALRF